MTQPTHRTSQPRRGSVLSDNPLARGIVLAQTGDNVRGWTHSSGTVSVNNTRYGRAQQFNDASLTRGVTSRSANSCTIASIFRRDTAGFEMALGSFGGGSNSFLLYLVGGSQPYMWNASTQVASGFTANVGEWNVAVGRSGPSLCDVWVNGTLLAGNTTGATHTVDTVAVGGYWVGGFLNSSYRMRGDLALTVVWDRCLSDAEVREFFRNPWQIFRQAPRLLDKFSVATELTTYYPVMFDRHMVASEWFDCASHGHSWFDKKLPSLTTTQSLISTYSIIEGIMSGVSALSSAGLMVSNSAGSSTSVSSASSGRSATSFSSAASVAFPSLYSQAMAVSAMNASGIGAGALAASASSVSSSFAASFGSSYLGAQTMQAVIAQASLCSISTLSGSTSQGSLMTGSLASISSGSSPTLAASMRSGSAAAISSASSQAVSTSSMSGSSTTISLASSPRSSVTFISGASFSQASLSTPLSAIWSSSASMASVSSLSAASSRVTFATASLSSLASMSSLPASISGKSGSSVSLGVASAGRLAASVLSTVSVSFSVCAQVGAVVDKWVIPHEAFSHLDSMTARSIAQIEYADSMPEPGYACSAFEYGNLNSFVDTAFAKSIGTVES